MTTQTIVILLLLVPLALLLLACIEGWKAMSSPHPQGRVKPQKRVTGTSQVRRPLLHRGPYPASGADGGHELAFEHANQRLGPRLAGSPANCALMQRAPAALTLKSCFRVNLPRGKRTRPRGGPGAGASRWVPTATGKTGGTGMHWLC